MVKWKKMNKKMAGLLLGVMMLFTASTTAFPPLFCDSYRSRSLVFDLTGSGICI